MEQVLVGKGGVIELMLAAVFSGGHVLVEDVPGIGKTILGMFSAKPGNATDFTRIDDRPGKLRRGSSNIIESDHVDHTCFSRCPNHRPAVFKRGTERFLTKDGFADGHCMFDDRSVG